MNNLIRCRAANTNMLLNFGPTKNGILTADMYRHLDDFAQWMKVNSKSVKGTHSLEDKESASVYFGTRTKTIPK
ncbi:alpha-L-fucosidase [Pedobacter borealis]|uniref:alpha-L-fucosidase n=1 Tax=Pedobacter borealis TaxID=475254 RepID=UPI0009F929CE